MNTKAALRNVVLVLQARPEDYQKFGVYWWAIKSMLKAAGYGPDDLAVLGDYMPSDAEDLIVERAKDSLLAAAFNEFTQSQFTGILASETADGEEVVVVDPDSPI